MIQMKKMADIGFDCDNLLFFGVASNLFFAVDDGGFS